MKVLPWGVCLYFIHTGFYNILFLKTWRKCLYLKVISLFLHFSSTDIHQNLELYSSLYYEGFTEGICLYFIHTGFTTFYLLKTWRKCLYLKVSSLFLHFSSTDIHQNLELYSSLYYEGFPWGDLFIFHSHWFYNILFLKNMAKMPIFKGKEFVSPLQQHWHTPNLELYSSLYSEGFHWGICLYFIHTDLYNISFLQTWRKCLYLKVISLFLHFSNTDIHQNLELYSSLYLKVFSEGFVYISFTLVYTIFYP